MNQDNFTIEYICPLTREECVNCATPKENPFTGTPMLKQCAWGTKDGGCAVAKLMQAIYQKEGL